MINRKIAIIFFSASNNTATITDFLDQKLRNIDKSLKVDKIDITSYSVRQNQVNIDQYDAILFGFPVYEWRAPNVVRDWLHTLDGNNKKCSVFFTYGGVKIGAAHHDIKQILGNNGFHLISTAEFPCKHTYNFGGWKMMQNRPNESDFKIAEEYIIKTYKLFCNEINGFLQIEDPNISENIFHNLEKVVKKAIKPPSRKGNECSLCKICSDLCPTDSMDYVSGEADPNTCLRCFRCFINCPEKVLKIEDLYPKFLKFEKLVRIPNKEEEVKSIYYIIKK